MRCPPFLLCFALAAGCAPDPAEIGPVEALTTFLASVERSTYAPELRREAFEWIDVESQGALKQRAELGASLVGHALKPWEMLVPGRLGFSLRSMGKVRLEARVEGNGATVSIPVHNRDAVEVPMVREQGRWRVRLGLTPKPSE